MCLMLTGVSVNAASTYSIPCDYLSISNMFATNVEGDVVTILPGTAYITNFIQYNRNISFTLHGSGTNLTTLVSMNDGSSIGWLWYRSSSANVYTISDMNCIGNTGDGGGFIETGDNPPGPKMAGFGHFYNLQMTNIQYRGILPGYCDSFVLIDHCYFAMPTQTGGGGFNPVSFGGNSYFSWTNPIPLGTSNNCFVEDCTFSNLTLSVGNGMFDAYNGAQFVIRYCVFSGSAANGSHGYDSGQTASRSHELYNNKFYDQKVQIQTDGTRGGMVFTYSNEYWIATNTVTPISIAPALTYYRAANGEYQSTFGYNGYNLTNYYSGTATGGTVHSLIDSTAAGSTGNGCTLGTIRAKNLEIGALIKIVSGTGAGQSGTVTANDASSFTCSGTTFSPVPDSTSKYEVWPQPGFGEQFGNQPAYQWATSITGAGDVNRTVLIGATLSACYANLIDCVNEDPTKAGITYAEITTNTASGRQDDMRGLFVASNSQGVHAVFTNILDGLGAFGYPAAYQPGVANTIRYTNSGVILQACYSCSNLVHNFNGSLTNINFIRSFEGNINNGLNFVTDTIVQNRDYYQDTLPPIQPYIYPHPLNFLHNGGANSQIIIPPKTVFMNNKVIYFQKNRTLIFIK